MYPLPGRTACKTAYTLLRGIGPDKLQTLTDELKSRQSAGTANLAPQRHGNLGVSRPSMKTEIALAFVFWLVASCGDHNPVTGLVHVWMFKCIVTIWAMFGKWCVDNNIEPEHKLGISSFFALFKRGGKWASRLAHVKWKRQVTQKICSTCGSLMLQRVQLFKNHVLRGAPAWSEWEIATAAHHALAFVERACYHKLRAEVRSALSTVSLYIMDASKPLRWPRRLFDSQSARSIPQLCGAFIGVICHSTSRAVAFLSPAPGIAVHHRERKAKGKVKARSAGTHYTWEGSDVNCTLLAIAVLHNWKAGDLRPHLYLQVDGGSDARGFVLVQMLSLFVCLGIVERVTIASLIPGHTHEDIDAFFSRLWKALKTRAGVRSHRTWSEMLECAQNVYPGWHNVTLGKIEASGVAAIPFVWKFGQLFGQGSGHSNQPCLSPKLKGLFGAGKDHAKKPSKFFIETHNGVPCITAYLSSVDGAPIFGLFDKVPVFRFAPQLQDLTTHDLSVGWQLQHAALVAALDVGDVQEAGYTIEQREEIRSMECSFSAPPVDAFGPLNHPRMLAVLALGYAPLKGMRVAGAGGDAANGRAARVQRGVISDDEDDGDREEWQAQNEQDDDIEAGELDESDEEVDESVVAEDEPEYEIEDWLDRRFNHLEQCDEYLIKFAGFPEPEWTLWRRLNSQVPKKVEEMFDRRTHVAETEARSMRAAAAWRAAARGGGLNDDEVDEAPDNDAVEPAPGQEPVEKRRRSKRTKIASKK